MPSTPRTIPVAFASFVALGVTAGLLGLAWPSMREQFHLELGAINHYLLASALVYLVPSFFIGRLFARFGSATVLIAGAIFLAVSMFGIAASPTWPVLVGFSSLVGLGSGLLDAGLNLYVATYHGPRQMSWLHASFGIGMTAGPLIMVAALHQRLGWRLGFGAAGIVVLAAVALLVITARAWRNDPVGIDGAGATRRASFARSFRMPAVWLGVGLFAACVGLEISAGQWAYTSLTQTGSLASDPAGVVVSAHWAAFTGGRILFGFAAHRFNPQRLLSILFATMLTGALLFWWRPVPAVAVVGLLALGAAEAPVFPLLMSGTARRAGAEHAENAVGLQMVASGLAVSLIPGAIGTATEHFGPHAIPLSLIALAALALALHAIIKRTRPSPADVAQCNEM